MFNRPDRATCARLRPRALGIGTLCALAALALPADLPAQAPAAGNVNAVNFFPIGGRHRIFAVELSQVAPTWEPYAHVLFHGEQESLKLTAGDHEELLVASHYLMDLNLGVGLFGFLQLEVGLPVALAMESDASTTAITPVSGAGIGDLVVRLRGTPLDNFDGGWGVGISAGITAPTGDGEHFRGDPGVGVLANVIADYRWPIVDLALNVGVRARTETSDLLGVPFDHELTYGLGILVSPFPGVIDIGAEVFGRTRLTEPFQDLDTTSLEAILGPKWWIIDGLSIELGVGMGLVQGYGTPSFRFLTGIVWAPPRRS